MPTNSVNEYNLFFNKIFATEINLNVTILAVILLNFVSPS